MKTEENTIDLRKYIAKDSSVLTGRPYGKAVRESSGIDMLETKFEQVNIIIPENIYSIGPSFLEELFFNVIKKLGKEKFFIKFKFVHNGKYDYKTPLNEAIERVLRKTTAIG